MATHSLRARAWRNLGLLIHGYGRTSQNKLRDAVGGRTVLVTGASFGIGEATARRLGAAGATVLIAARSSEPLQAVADAINAEGGTAHAYPTDLTEPTEVDTLVKRLIDEHGQVDVLVNNAGKSIRRSLARSYDRPQDFERTIDVNYLGPVRLTMGLLPAMRARGRGHIVNVSTQGVRPFPVAPGWSAYLASKTAFEVWMRSMALEVRGDGVTASNVYMGLVHTRMSAPTPSLSRLPGLTPQDAARLVCDAIVRKPRSITPWWSPAVSVGNTLLSRPIETMLGTVFRRGEKGSAR
ncbi:SDR family NAD(P)-dependent oxidoreductase [Amycolatopsis cihanbeyliensis]|uniref:SDR family NAD(P)-dependent oxidoreductase n=1 Tax=Amycolatopsis cihanbeyliensis TaxID=1128664 RepID=UPI001FEBBBCA|nr:SDR family NAD(P)-dependent oxidoreductase [Amycolatopsis cihanbeyliensis]